MAPMAEALLSAHLISVLTGLYDWSDPEKTILAIIYLVLFLSYIAFTVLTIYMIIHTFKSTDKRALQKLLHRVGELRPQQQYEGILKLLEENDMRIRPRDDYFKICQADAEYMVLWKLTRVPWNEQYLEIRRMCLERGVPFDESETWEAILQSGPPEWETREDDGYESKSDSEDDEDYQPSADRKEEGEEEEGKDVDEGI